LNFFAALFPDWVRKGTNFLSKYGIDLADRAGENQPLKIASVRLSRNLLTLSAEELIAHGKTRHEIARYINADEVIYQSLEDLKAACIEAAEGESKVKDFEVGLFTGKYITEVPEGYFEYLSQLRGKKGKTAVGATKEEAGAGGAFLIANSGPVDVAFRQQRVSEDDGAGTKSPDYQEDIRYVTSNDMLELLVLINTFTVFTIL
jgi:hypothetical protein